MVGLIDVLAAGVTDSSGSALSSGRVYFYEAGTSNLLTVYQERALETPHSNPATLDTAGVLKAYTNTRVKIRIETSAGALVREIDNIGIAAGDIGSTDLADGSVTAAKIGTGSVTETKIGSQSVSSFALEQTACGWYGIHNARVVASVASNAATFALKTLAGNDPSTDDPVVIVVGGITGLSPVSSGNTIRIITSALSITVPNTATLGHSSGKDEYVNVYLLANTATSTNYLAVTGGKVLDEAAAIASTAISTTADLRTVPYASDSVSNLKAKLLARVQSNQSSAGVWASSLFTIQFGVLPMPTFEDESFADSGNGQGSTNTGCRRFSNQATVGTAITYADSATLGATWTINSPGIYEMVYVDKQATSIGLGITLNATTLNDEPKNLTNTQVLAHTVSVSGEPGCVTSVRRLWPGDIVRTQATLGMSATNSYIFFRIRKLAN